MMDCTSQYRRFIGRRNADVQIQFERVGDDSGLVAGDPFGRQNLAPDHV